MNAKPYTEKQKKAKNKTHTHPLATIFPKLTQQRNKNNQTNDQCLLFPRVPLSCKGVGCLSFSWALYLTLLNDGVDDRY